MKLKSSSNFSFITAGMVVSFASLAAPVTTGEFVLDFDEAALVGLPTKIVNSVWYDETDSANKTATEITKGKAQGPVPDSFTFKVFGSTISTPPKGLEGRNPVASTFAYTGDPTTGTGKIGLAGVHQLTGAFDGALISGDYGLNFDKDRVGNSVGGSGWYLNNNISFSLPVYDLTNVKTTLIDDNNFALSGDVVLTSANAQMMLATAGTDVGDFTFTTLAQTSSVAHYSVKSEKLVLPVVKVADANYSATLKLVNMNDGSFAFDLLSAKKTTESPTAQSASHSSTGVVAMPLVESTANDGQKNNVKAEMKLIESSSPLRFVLTNVENVAK